jgi:hypothetical protein
MPVIGKHGKTGRCGIADGLFIRQAKQDVPPTSWTASYKTEIWFLPPSGHHTGIQGRVAGALQSEVNQFYPEITGWPRAQDTCRDINHMGHGKLSLLSSAALTWPCHQVGFPEPIVREDGRPCRHRLGYSLFSCHIEQDKTAATGAPRDQTWTFPPRRQPARHLRGITHMLQLKADPGHPIITARPRAARSLALVNNLGRCLPLESEPAIFLDTPSLFFRGNSYCRRIDCAFHRFPPLEA